MKSTEQRLTTIRPFTGLDASIYRAMQLLPEDGRASLRNGNQFEAFPPLEGVQRRRLVDILDEALRIVDESQHEMKEQEQ